MTASKPCAARYDRSNTPVGRQTAFDTRQSVTANDLADALAIDTATADTLTRLAVRAGLLEERRPGSTSHPSHRLWRISPNEERNTRSRSRRGATPTTHSRKN